MARFSIRGLLAAVALVAVACAALKYAGPLWWTILSAAAMLLLMGAVVIAIAGNGEKRVKAIAFITCFLIYAALVLISPADELHVSRGRLPTTTAMKPIVLAVASYDDAGFLSSLDASDITVEPGAVGGFDIPDSGLIAQPTSRAIAARFIPDHAEFLRIAHLLWATLFGLLGSMLARSLSCTAFHTPFWRQRQNTV